MLGTGRIGARLAAAGLAAALASGLAPLAAPVALAAPGNVFTFDHSPTPTYPNATTVVLADAAMSAPNPEPDRHWTYLQVGDYPTDWWGVQLIAPEGEHLAIGTYANVGSVFGPSDEPRMRVGQGAGDACGEGGGWFRIDELAWDGDRVASLSVDITCGGDASFASQLRFNSSRPVDPVASSASRVDWTRTLAGTAAEMPVTLTGAGPGAVHPGTATIEGEDASDFTIQADGCAGASLAAGSSCDVVVDFAPADGPALERLAVLRIPVDSLAGSRAVPLRGLVRRPTTITIASDANPSLSGQVTFTATVTPQPPYDAIVWTIDGVDGGNHPSSILSSQRIGAYAVSARYAGSDAYAPSSPATIQQVTYRRTSIRWDVWPAFNQPPGVLTITAYADTSEGGTLTITDETTGTVLGSAEIGPAQTYVHLPAIELPGLHILRADYTGVAPYILPSESSILVEGTPPGPSPAASLYVSGMPSLRHAGVAGALVVRALDARGSVVTDYAGTVAVTSSDPAAILPPNSTFTGGDRGTITLPLALNTLGEQTVTVLDTETGAIVGTGQVDVAGPFDPSSLAPIDVAVADDHACAVGADGIVRCWGSNEYGALGNGSYSSADSPVTVDRLTTATAVTVASTHSCAVIGDGTAWCWGRNVAGETPSDDYGSGRAPAKVPGVEGAVDVAMGDAFACALIGDGSVRCWGRIIGSWPGEIALPVPGVAGATAVTAGQYHACARIGDGSLRCWGENGWGQLGDGTTAARGGAVQVAGITSAEAIGAGASSTCAALADGTVRCWGHNHAGQLGDGSTTDRPSPVTVAGLSGATAVATAAAHACARLADGRVVCWGENTRGQLGDGSTASSLTPVQAGISGATVIASGGQTTCAIGEAGIRCWGRSDLGQTGDASRYAFTPVDPVGLGTGAIPADHGPCAILADGTVRCWSGMGRAALDPVTGGDASPVPVPIDGLDGVVNLSATGNTACAVLGDGTIRCWGNNPGGVLGDGTTMDRWDPVTVPGITTATSVSVGGMHACARLSDGGAACWGNNLFGQLGDGSTGGSKLGPVRVAGVDAAVRVAAGGYHSCALLVDGSVRCWGSDQMGELGDGGSYASSPTPVVVEGLEGVTSISTFGDTTCARASDGSAWCWGYNESGQAGADTPPYLRAPARNPDVVGAATISVGSQSVCAVDTDHLVRCWGRNGSGQLGDGTREDRPTPTVVPGVAASSVATGAVTTCVAASDGAVRCWGAGGWGQIGNGTRPYAAAPVAVAWPDAEPLATMLEMPPSSASLTVPLTLTTTLDPSRIARWYLSEVYSAPGWTAEVDTATAPTSFTFKPGDRERELHAWVTDTHGNVSLAATSTILIDSTPPAATGHLPAVTRTREVPIDVTGGDDGTGVTGWLVSEVPISPTPSDQRWAPEAPVAVTLTPGDGTKRVYVWTRDGAGNVSVPSAPKTLLDTTPPVGGGAPVATIRGAGTGATSTVPMTLVWAAASDAQPGKVRYELRMRAGTAGPVPVTQADPEATSMSVALKPGTYRFEVRAVDRAGNTGPWRTAPAATVLGVVQETSSSVAYTGRFTRNPLTGSAGGFVRSTGVAGRSASLKVTARSLAFVSTKGPSRGKAQVWVDGVKVATIDLYAATRKPGIVVWSRSWKSTETHRLRIVVTGTKRSASTSTRVDVDAFLVLR